MVSPAGTVSGSIGINAQTGAGGTISVTTTSTVTGNGGAAVKLTGGSTNTLSNSGTITTTGGLAGTAISAGSGNDTVNNTGTVVGLVDLGTGTNAFNNLAGSLFNAGVTVNLGAGNTLTNNGTFWPGAAGTVLTAALTGNFAQTSSGSYAVSVTPAAAGRTNISGTASLAGTAQAFVQAGNYSFGQRYTILTAAGGRSGTFASVTAGGPFGAAFKPTLSYDANDVFLVLTVNQLSSLLPSGTSQNQRAVAAAIDTGLAGGFGPQAFLSLFNLSPAGLSTALSQLSGEAATGSQQSTFNSMNLFLGLLTDPFIAGRDGGAMPGPSATPFVEESASAYASQGRTGVEREAYASVYTKAPPRPGSFDQRWSVWAAGYGGSQTTDGNATLGANDTTSRLGAVAVGADYRFSPYTIAGFALAGGGTSFSVTNGLGSGRSDLFQAGAFIRHTVGAAYLSGALAYGWQDITTDRTVTVAGLDQLRAKFNANAFSGRVEGGYRFVTPWMGITPYAAGQFTTFELPAYAEQTIAGTNNFALGYAAKNVTATRSELGLRADKSFAMTDGVFTLRGRAAWAHDYNADRNIAATFQTLPGASFVVSGARPATDAALVTASAERKWPTGFSLAGTFEGEFSNVTKSYAGKGVVRYQW